MLLGAHVSSAGGLWNAPKNAAGLGCEAFQMFFRPPQGGPAPEITEEITQKFKQEMRAHKLKWFCIHAPYFINFASIKPQIRHGSVSITRKELERGSALGAAYVMVHLGSFRDLGRKEGMKVLTEGLAEALDGYNGSTEFLIEISAGAGQVIGDTFENLGAIIYNKKLEQYKIGVCFDTQHAFASGYDLRTPDAVDKTWRQAEASLGKNKIKMSHCNDSMVGLGEHKDRHEHIGEGFMGIPAFEAIFEHPGFNKINFILETQHDKVRKDLKLLKKIRAGI